MKLPLTYRSAVKLLNAEDPATLRALDSLLGGAILAAGAVGFPVGSAVLAAVWGWVDQKSELLKLLGKAVGYARGRLGAASGYQRSQLITAAHTMLVGDALFHALQTHLGSAYRALELTDDEKKHLFADADVRQEYQVAIGALLDTRIDVPWAGQAYDANVESSVRPYLHDSVTRCLSSFRKLAVWERAWSGLGHQPSVENIVDSACRQYEENYFRLASEAPEFLVWAMLGGQRAASLAIKAARRELLEALRSQDDALRRVETVLSLVSHSTGAERDHAALTKAHRGILDQPLIRVGEMDGLTGVSIPSVEEGYVVPHFRFATVDRDSRPSSEEWWETHPVRSDLDEFLTGYLASARSTERPLIVLGHPGAGKSLLARVLTARLSVTSFPAFLVPLRRVRNPTAPIYQQVQEMLDESTHARVLWSSVAEADAGNTDGGATRVVLLDGLDELMQATGTTESGYLGQVQEFQRVEAAQEAPIAVVVTSRQVVADIANIPAGCLVLRLEDFTDAQVAQWISTWNRNNREPLSLQGMLDVGPITRQPLLLLMTAIQATTSGASTATAGEASVYRQLLVDFIRRELRKSAPREFSVEPPDDGLVNEEMWRLGIAAFGMFNRGRQFVTEEQLQADIVALDPRRSDRDQDGQFVRPLTEARRTIGRFFFIHTSETGETERRRKTYEFLHATFAEYLIAHHAVDRLQELIGNFADHRAGRLRPGVAWDNDEWLFALLSHRPVIAGGAIVRFLQQIFGGFDETARALGGEVLERLLGGADRRREKNREHAYNPGSRTSVQRLASYLTNLILLRLLLLPEQSIQLRGLAPAGNDPTLWWRSAVRLMQAGLNEVAWLEVLQTIEPFEDGGEPALRLRRTGLRSGSREVHEALLLFDREAVETVQVGTSLWRGVAVPAMAVNSAQVYAEVVARRLFGSASPGSAQPLLAAIRACGRLEPPASLAVVEYLLAHAPYLSLRETAEFVAASVTSVPEAVRAVPLVVLYPELLRLVPQLDYFYGQRLPATADFLRVAGAFWLINLIGSAEDQRLTWPLSKVVMRMNPGRRFLPDVVKKYGSVAAIADDTRAALLPAIVEALTQDLIRHAGTGPDER